MHWHQRDGWSFIWDHEAHPDLPFVLARLDLPVDTDPDGAAAALLTTAMGDHSDPARWPKAPWLPSAQGTTA
ncbi:hypothetical protein ACIQF6_36140 [Kitasatospora sp. NPDC092948]|uniref:hypothetical protein n=1 Tax=Kitasatospora sp. NPDC092948 TaxID=3364088 RepID=UPI0038058D78